TSTTSPKRSSPEPSNGAKKRASPEPTASTRKHAKTESISSKSKASTARKASISTSSSSSSSSTPSSLLPPSSPTAAAKTTKATTSSSSTSTSTSTSVSKDDKATAESLTSTANTTLSAATLQFLLQQQMQTPLIPQLFTGTLTREEIEATLARLLESTRHLIQTSDENTDITKVKEEAASDEESEAEADQAADQSNGAEPSHGLKTQPGIKTDDIPSSTDLKKMTSKERRQLRNKISARNFRVRRKGQVLQHKTEARHLREAVTLVQEENQRLKDELDQLKNQLAQATITGGSLELSSPTPTPLSKENQTLLSAIMNRNVTSAMNPNAKSNLTLSMARPQSPILAPNFHKDVPNSSSGSASTCTWKDKSPTMVHTTLVPEICFDNEFQFGQKLSPSRGDDMLDRPWLQENTKPEPSAHTMQNPFWVSGLVFELMSTVIASSVGGVVPALQQDPDMVSSVDWELQQNMWALATSTDANTSISVSEDNSKDVHDDDDEEDEEIQLLYNLTAIPTSTPSSNEDLVPPSRPSSPSGFQEDPNMLEWLYESMMARLVDLDLQSTHDHSFNPLLKSHSA
ncbi:hypothetical protein BGZ94_004858, partial [Podila epigama]